MILKGYDHETDNPNDIFQLTIFFWSSCFIIKYFTTV